MCTICASCTCVLISFASSAYFLDSFSIWFLTGFHFKISFKIEDVFSGQWITFVLQGYIHLNLPKPYFNGVQLRLLWWWLKYLSGEKLARVVIF